MPEISLDVDQIDAALAACDVVRVAFPDDPAPYVIPLGFIWDGVSMRGTGLPGRKTELTGDGADVGFQVDSSARTGLFEWVSIQGHGRFTVVEDEEERASAIAELELFASRAPEWWADEQLERAGSADFVVWSLTPTEMSGRRYSAAGATVAGIDVSPTEQGMLALDLMSATDMLDAARREDAHRLSVVMICQFVVIPLFMITAAQGFAATLGGLAVLAGVEIGLFKWMTGLAPAIARFEHSVEEAKAALEAERSVH